ncbi:diaminohydroxyphosphoribosylaminopyrimidine deaminase/5-amino-6-(5-phosphoribosylamino)uracil reductase [Desulfohalotomaculum tongense]|uniref:bifunctional diaminohydroxyphosphoribosylaminopyrimidine deaminase/5-amino-6-(5-phosphoribosylamino)uracil reductase RibD n=1 Tax=Desulforadius tongensis TaxID=1216062 RepID=UPI00195D6EC1|nr:bifunctional diaminohydroxyphosphoribosylaminopyrimidine deaminase/5-amino-6-(5-phosphoribosylamino)uracil reductase RibD [Desulforadius tongensis]MBM7855756.1 diaminohydroxyphosphoribosylaminopyrimidine deaminase/5-amino-6-(5-phosphoribosylamino)uracil reductase [Desulforadius tongensis]
MLQNDIYQDRYYMKEALQLAAKAEGCTSPNPMVGAVVVKNGRIVGRGYHQRAGTPHAEVHALREAGEQAEGATIYVTLEPCCHYGRTPPCTEAIKKAGISRVVVAITDPNPLVAGRGLNILKEAGIEVTSGVLADEAGKLNEVFIKYITTNRPFVVLKAAVSLDGKIATATGESQWITGPESREYAHRLRHRYDGILVGINTVLSDNPSLTARLPEGGGRDPVRIVLDSKCRTPLDAKIINQSSKAKTIIATTEAADREKIEALKQAGAEVIVLPGSSGRVDIEELLKELGRREITSLLVEGGGGVHGSFLTAKMVDKVYWFIAPMLIGGAEAPGAVAGRGAEKLADAVKLKELTIHRFGPDICIEGYVD